MRRAVATKKSSSQVWHEFFGPEVFALIDFFSASLAQDFLDTTATQLTYRGLCELNTNLKDGALCVFFRNNHFSTLLKHDVSFADLGLFPGAKR